MSVKVGIVKYMNHASLNRIERGALKGLKQCSEEYGIKIEANTYDGLADDAVMRKIAHTLVEEKVNLVISIATPPTVAMKPILQENKIPMIFRAVSDPISAKVIDSFQCPGEYITGTSDGLDGALLVDSMLKIKSEISKVGVLYCKNEISAQNPIKEAKERLDVLGIEWIDACVENRNEVVDAAKMLVEKKVDAVINATDNTIMAEEKNISSLFIEANIYQFTGSHAFVINGAFMGLGSFYKDGDKEFYDLIKKIIIDKTSCEQIPVTCSAHSFVALNNQICDAFHFDKTELTRVISTMNMATYFLDSEAEFGEEEDV